MWDKIVPGSMDAPKFSAFPWPALPRRTRREAAIESAIARWLDARVRIVRVGAGVAIDPNAASCELRSGGESIIVYGSAALVRAIAQRRLGGPAELAAPRPLGVVERALWARAVAEATGHDVWPRLDAAPVDGIAIELEVAGGTAVAIAPHGLALRAPPERALPAWADRVAIDAPIVVARCALPADAVAALAVRDLVTVERAFALEIFGGELGLVAHRGPAAQGVAVEVASEYVRRDMALADDASVELAVTLGTTRLSLRQVLGLAVGEVIALGRPLGGPFDVRAAGQVVGKGELVDVDGELAVRIVSLEK